MFQAPLDVLAPDAIEEVHDQAMRILEEIGVEVGADAAIDLLRVLVSDDHEIVTLIEGEGATAADTRRITEWLAEERPDVSAEIHHGGQPLYPYLLGVE